MMNELMSSPNRDFAYDQAAKLAAKRGYAMEIWQHNTRKRYIVQASDCPVPHTKKGFWRFIDTVQPRPDPAANSETRSKQMSNLTANQERIEDIKDLLASIEDNGEIYKGEKAKLEKQLQECLKFEARWA